MLLDSDFKIPKLSSADSNSLNSMRIDYVIVIKVITETILIGILKVMC